MAALHVRCTALHKSGVFGGRLGSAEAQTGNRTNTPAKPVPERDLALPNGGGGIRTLEAPYDA